MVYAAYHISEKTVLSFTYHQNFLSGSPFSKVWHRLSHYQMTMTGAPESWGPESSLAPPESPLVLDKSWIHISE